MRLYWPSGVTIRSLKKPASESHSETPWSAWPLELAVEDGDYENIALQTYEQFLAIANAIGAITVILSANIATQPVASACFRL